MICCPFHEDHTPSLKLYEDHFYCFGCGASGDVIDFTARLFNLNPSQALQKLEADFGISSARPPPVDFQKSRQAAKRKLLRRTLYDYLCLLERNYRRYAPQKQGEAPDDRFTESCHNLCYVQYLLDCLDSDPDGTAAAIEDSRLYALLAKRLDSTGGDSNG